VVAKVLAALQRMGRKPPPALLVDPEDVLKAIRTSMLLGDLLPAMRSEVERLVVDLTALTEARKAVQAERRNLDAEIASLTAERERLSALVEARQAALGKAQGAMADEAEKAKRLAGEAGSLKDLIGRMERDDTAAAKGAAAARQSDAKLAAITPDASLAVQPFKDPARLAPAVAFDKTRGLLPMPVSGALLRGFGDDDGLGGTEKGMLLATPVTAPVTAPADGWIAYAGPYRSFGQLLILNVGSGYYIVLAGMDRINVGLGQFVLAGEPIGAMGDGSTKTAAAVALGAAQPLLYVEFRKDGATIDPGPWWARPELQKVRG
jgi:murein hydrolase activator